MAKHTLAVSFNSAHINAAIDQLGHKAVQASREGARQGGEHMFYQARLECPVSAEAHVFYGHGGKYPFEPGNLRNSIYMVYSKDHSSATRSTYHIAWNHQKAPYGFMVEFGTARATANPWLRRTYDRSSDEAVKLAESWFRSEMSEVL
jgi:hypothetical protein